MAEGTGYKYTGGVHACGTGVPLGCISLCEAGFEDNKQAAGWWHSLHPVNTFESWPDTGSLILKLLRRMLEEWTGEVPRAVHRRCRSLGDKSHHIPSVRCLLQQRPFEAYEL